jgi:replicative superfamily II helicase
MLINGISKDLVDLISIKGIGRVKAMKLFAVGITNKEEMLAATKVAPAIIGPKLFGDLVAVGNRKGLITFNF